MSLHQKFLKIVWFTMLLCGTLSTARAQHLAEVRWQYRLEHFTPAEAPAYDAWIIEPQDAATRVENFGSLMDLLSGEGNSNIEHVYLRNLVRQPETRDAVMKYVEAQPEFKKNPPPAGFGRWEFKNSKTMRRLVEQGILKSPLVVEISEQLAKHGKTVRSVSMEKLFFTKKEGDWSWDAMVWLMIDAPNPGKAGGKK